MHLLNIKTKENLCLESQNLLIDCLTTRQYKKVNGQELQSIIPYVTQQQQCNKVHIKRSSYINATTGYLIECLTCLLLH